MKQIPQTKIRILHLEDNPLDEELQNELLKAEGFVIESVRVDTRGALIAMLEQGGFDLILADNAMPGFDGLSALKIAREKAPHIPFVFVSGTLGEEVAIESLKNGATDYVLKQRLERLAPVIHRALREEAERRERERVEENLRQSENRYRLATKATNDVIWDWNPETNQLIWAEHAQHIFGYLPGEIGPDESWWDERIHPEDRERVITRLNDLIAGSETIWREDYRFLRRDGSYAHISDHGYIERDARGKAIRMIGAMSDITGRKLVEEALRKLNAELEQRVAERTSELNRTNLELERANRAKDEFLATMSHELRTPLNSILGLSETLLEELRGPLNEHQRSSLQIIESSGRHLLELINDVLDLSKIEAGRFDYYPQAVDVDMLCRSSLAFVKEQALRKSITLDYQASAVVSQLYADPRRLKQILVNLLTNAVKFTALGGQVTLKVDANANEDLVQFSVTDTGIGIAPEDLKRLFQPFVQVDSNLNRQFEGTGLGLALVERLTDLHGGSVQVESHPGKGSRFTINLRWGQGILKAEQTSRSEYEARTAKQIEPSSPSSENFTRLVKILLAEDNPANILTIREYLKYHGYQVITAHDGVETLEKAQAHNPDLILMDIQMPVMDGLEATRRLRADARFASTPIIALTALAMPGDRERCLEAGANEYMSKPITLQNLARLIANFLEQGQ